MVYYTEPIDLMLNQENTVTRINISVSIESTPERKFRFGWEPTTKFISLKLGWGCIHISYQKN